MKHQRYLLWLLLFCCLTLLPAIALNWVLLRNEGDVTAISFAASDWQHQTHGITLTPTLGNNGLFKTLRLNDRLPEIDTVILGSSTGMPIDSTMLPPDWRLYNMTMSGSPLSSSIAQARYLAAHAPQVKRYIIALDWALGFVYQPADTIAAADLATPQRSATDPQSPSLIATLQEAMSYPRMEKLGKILRELTKSPNPEKTFREYFLQLGSDEYLCPDGVTRGKDFGIYNRGSCNGFRYDGSATFSDYNRISDASRLLISALAFGSKYVHALKQTDGAIDPGLFRNLAELDRTITAHGGMLILYMPPLMPGLEKAFLDQPQLSIDLLRTKRELNAWAAANNAIVLDFGQSEKFGCAASEFLDEHHAVGSCYKKIFQEFWNTQTGRAIAGQSVTATRGGNR